MVCSIALKSLEKRKEEERGIRKSKGRGEIEKEERGQLSPKN